MKPQRRQWLSLRWSSRSSRWCSERSAGPWPGGLITGAQVQNGSLTGVDVRNGSLGAVELSPAARRALRGLRGLRGVPGAAGATGVAGI